jgi:hypothetical protein
MPLFGQKAPGVQEVGVVILSEGQKLPTGQGTGKDRLALGQKLPMGQLLGNTRPWGKQNVPKGHGKHASGLEERDTPLYDPAGQATGADSPLMLQKKPTGQGMARENP